MLEWFSFEWFSENQTLITWLSVGFVDYLCRQPAGTTLAGINDS